ncbi:hypothetical protein B0T17DRAFT_567026 [Bombardia bombarda]|uniref:Uncharacterized protein n=1 Tax=Bombardia bombarda TaxID=252184 RepID=A0AA39XI84_9PEZI|nr:hypothetical protein B0T17DRAFT_567026 [Bombardia bombarda]
MGSFGISVVVIGLLVFFVCLYHEVRSGGSTGWPQLFTSPRPTNIARSLLAYPGTLMGRQGVIPCIICSIRMICIYNLMLNALDLPLFCSCHR